MAVKRWNSNAVSELGMIFSPMRHAAHGEALHSHSHHLTRGIEQMQPTASAPVKKMHEDEIRYTDSCHVRHPSASPAMLAHISTSLATKAEHTIRHA